MHETWWLNWRWITSCEQLVQPQPGLSHPGRLMNHLKAAAWAGDWLLVSFVNITWPVSRHVPCQRPSYTSHKCPEWWQSLSLHTKYNSSDDTWTLNRSDLYFAPGLSSCAGCCEASCEAAEPEVRPGRERGSGMLLMQTEFIYQLSIALISLKTKTLLPTNLQANKFCISCAGEKNWTNKNSQTIHHRNCLQDLFSRFSDAGRWSALWLRLRPVVSWRLVICFRVKVL